MEMWAAGLAVLAVVITVLVLHVFLYYWLSRNVRFCRSWVDLTGKTAIVTGANTGLGYEVARDLAWRHARVILACRDEKKAADAAQTIRTATANPNIIAYHLDLSSLASVREFVARFKRQEGRLDILINNAGTLGSSYTTTREGLEVIFATNHLGPFLLTTSLLDMLRASAPSRVVNVSSDAHRIGTIDFKHPRGKPAAWPRPAFQIYSNTKLANVLFTRELARRLRNTGVTANCLHPGIAPTQLYRNLFTPLRWYLYNIGKYILMTPEQAAQTSIYLAVSEEIDQISGRYFENMKIVREAKHARDDSKARELWRLSEEYTRLI